MLVANCISPVVELSYPLGDMEVQTLNLLPRAFSEFHPAFTPPSLILNICYLFVACQRECTIRHDSFVNDVVFT